MPHNVTLGGRQAGRVQWPPSRAQHGRRHATAAACSATVACYRVLPSLRRRQFERVHAGKGVVAAHVAPPQQVAGVAVERAVGRRVCGHGKQRGGQGRGQTWHTGEAAADRKGCEVGLLARRACASHVQEGVESGWAVAVAGLSRTGRPHAPDMRATMAWHTECSVQAGLHAFLRMSRQISPVWGGEREAAWGGAVGNRQQAASCTRQQGRRLATASSEGSSKWRRAFQCTLGWKICVRNLTEKQGQGGERREGGRAVRSRHNNSSSSSGIRARAQPATESNQPGPAPTCGRHQGILLRHLDGQLKRAALVGRVARALRNRKRRARVEEVRVLVAWACVGRPLLLVCGGRLASGLDEHWHAQQQQ